MPHAVRRSIAVLALCLSAAALSACGELPRPFTHQGLASQDNPLVLPRSALGVGVAPVEGLEEDEATAMAQAMVQALLAREVVAMKATDAPPQGLLLQGFTHGGAVFWSLSDHDGYLLRHFDETPGADTLSGIAEALAAYIATDPGAPGQMLPLRLDLPDDLPGDGGVSLYQAMARALPGFGLQVSESGDTPDAAAVEYGVRLDFTKLPLDAGHDMVTFTWIVEDSSGAELGRVHQSNTVPGELLRGAWGGLARAVAQGGAEGVAEVVKSLHGIR